MLTARDRFLEKLQTALEDGSFVKLTLSRRREEGDLRNVYARKIELKSGTAISFNLRFQRRDETRNEAPAKAVRSVGYWMENDFEEGHLFTTAGDWKVSADVGGQGKLKASRPSFLAAPAQEHDHKKARALTAARWLVDLGVTAADGTPRAGMADKLRQIERFVELLGHLVDASPLKQKQVLRIADLGAGKGYLTFAAHEFFLRRGVEVHTTGVELRPELVDQTNRIAKDCGLTGLNFVAGGIADFSPEQPPDVLLALHACDTATDDALLLGVRADAALIVTAPCCHKEVRGQLTAPPILAGVLRHGILAERQAELLTDGLRAMWLEAHGYEARVFEFIAPEHTGKNVMIAATKHGSPVPAMLDHMREVAAAFGVRRLRLF